MNITDGEPIINVLNNFTLWNLKAREDGESIAFEAWVKTEEEKTALFEALKPFVDEYGESIDWHECTHDEAVSQPCVIMETYTRG